MTQEEVIDTYSSINRLRPQLRVVSVKFRLISLSDIRHVKSKRTGKILQVREAIVADDTGKIKLSLWNEEVDALIEGRCYELRYGRVEVYDESMKLSRGFSGRFVLIRDCFNEVNLEHNMSKPFIWMPTRRVRERSKEGRTFQGTPGRVQRGYCSEKEF
ncbi:MAG: hypothetical protein ACFFF4_01315 [Candidatus Thorarchaeota archaeon]